MSLAVRCAGLPRSLRRIVALVVVPLLLLLVIATVILPATALWRSQLAWREDAIRVLAEARLVPRIGEQLEQQRAIAEESTLWSRVYARSSSTSGATALHSDVRAVLAQAGTSAQSLTPIPAQELDFFSQLGIRCTASMRMDQLRQFMELLGRHPRYLRIDRLVVVAPQSQSPQENPPLAVTMDIVGFERDMTETSSAPSREGVE